jgi:hypothetical protein
LDRDGGNQEHRQNWQEGGTSEDVLIFLIIKSRREVKFQKRKEPSREK